MIILFRSRDSPLSIIIYHLCIRHWLKRCKMCGISPLSVIGVGPRFTTDRLAPHLPIGGLTLWLRILWVCAHSHCALTGSKSEPLYRQSLLGASLVPRCPRHCRLASPPVLHILAPTQCGQGPRPSLHFPLASRSLFLLRLATGWPQGFVTAEELRPLVLQNTCHKWVAAVLGFQLNNVLAALMPGYQKGLMRVWYHLVSNQ